MKRGIYEVHVHPDPSFPVIFHRDRIEWNTDDFILHWHEAIELLYFIDGEATVFEDGSLLNAEAGDIIVVNSDCMHSVRAKSEQVSYYCLILDLPMCEAAGFSLETLYFDPKIRNKEAAAWFDRIVAEYETETAYYKIAIKSNISGLLVQLLRCRSAEPNERRASQTSKAKMVKAAIRLMQQDYGSVISLTDLAGRLGFSRYYLCRTFRELTGYTVTQYLNLLRCTNAKKLLACGWSVSEAAVKCGYESLSYFTRTYKRYIGTLPSAENSENPT